MLHLGVRKRFIAYNPFGMVEPLRQRAPHPPHILNFENEARILAVATPHIRALVVLILETGLRSHREALALKWADIDFSDDVIRIQESKTAAGIRSIPISSRCKTELLRWRDRVGPEYSLHAFPNMRTPTKPMKNVRHAWAKTLTDAGLEYF
jgi:integrase